MRWLAKSLTSLAIFLPGFRPGVGMFFETVNRIWRMDCPPMWLQRWGDGVGWFVRSVCKLAKAK
jgi:hypothetical protein